MEINLNSIQFNDNYRNKRVLITGHTGFKGTWLALWLKKLGADVYGISIQNNNNSHYYSLNLDIKTYNIDIRNLNQLSDVIKKIQPDIVFHLAAQALVKEGYLNPEITYQTNVMGTFNVFESVKKLLKETVIINVTSDKVYKNNEWQWPFREDDVLGGFDPYSSSKAMSELLTDSFRNSFFNLSDYGTKHNVLLASVRAGNVIGGGDWAEDRIIPDIFRATMRKETVDIRNPWAIRPWQHVLEPLSGYLLLGSKLLDNRIQLAKAWNFGPIDDANTTVNDLVSQMSNEWTDIKYKRLDYNGPHEAGILKLDSYLSKSELEWKPVLNLAETIKFTAKWYKEYIISNTIISEQQLKEYFQLALEQSQVWIKKK